MCLCGSTPEPLGCNLSQLLSHFFRPQVSVSAQHSGAPVTALSLEGCHNGFPQSCSPLCNLRSSSNAAFPLSIMIHLNLRFGLM
jgi:hypothetical protein